MAHRKVYLAVGRKNTRIYRFDPVDGDTRMVEEVEPYGPGFSAMGAQYRGETKEPLLYAVSEDRLVAIDVEAGTLDAHPVEGLPAGTTWYDGDTDVSGSTLLVGGGPHDPTYSIDLAARRAVPGNAPGSGRWDDFAHHPKDGRLIAVEGDNGDLLLIDPARDPMKTVLKARVFPPAQASGSDDSRKSYAATFFDTEGNFYAVDSAGNVHHLDMTGPDVPDGTTRVGGARIPVDDLEVVNGAGRITPLPVRPSYEQVVISKEQRGKWENWDPRGVVYSVRLTLKAELSDNGTGVEVHRFRISFDLPTLPGAKVMASGVDAIYEDGKAYVDSQADQLLAAGQERQIDVQVTVPGNPDTLPKEYPLAGLRATRLG